LKKGVESMDKLFTIAETADYLRVSKMTIYRWIDSGRLNSIKINQKHLIAESEIKRLIKGE
jgi:putative resolvase